MKKYIVEHEYDGYEIGTYLKETKGYSSRDKFSCETPITIMFSKSNISHSP